MDETLFQELPQKMNLVSDLFSRAVFSFPFLLPLQWTAPAHCTESALPAAHGKYPVFPAIPYPVPDCFCPSDDTMSHLRDPAPFHPDIS